MLSTTLAISFNIVGVNETLIHRTCWGSAEVSGMLRTMQHNATVLAAVGALCAAVWQQEDCPITSKEK